MKTRHIKNISKPRISASRGAAELGALIGDRVSEVRIVDEGAAAEYVLLPSADLAEMIEDAQACAAYNRTRGEEAVPIELVDRLNAGENPIKVWREYRGMTATALADAAKIGKGYLSQLERGSRRGPVATLQRLAEALRIDIDDLT